MRQQKAATRKGFTLIETLFVLAILGIVGGISLPVALNAVKEVDAHSLLESTVYGLRQFFVDVRSQSILKPNVYRFNEDSSTQLSFSGGGENYRYTIPEGFFEQEAALEVEAKNWEYSYVLGYFVREKQQSYEILDPEEREFHVKILLGETVAATVSIVNGLPLVEVPE